MGLFRSDPVKKAKGAYEAKMKDAMEAQRNGNIQLYAELNEQAQQLLEKVKTVEASNQK